jgi:RNA polymerase sigma factor (sigma-70 family)
MALTPVKHPPVPVRRPSAMAPTSLPQPSFAPRISHADELQLACRLAECRRELLSLALHDTRTFVELARLCAELDSGLLNAGALLEADGSTVPARERFEHWVEAVRRLQREAASSWSHLADAKLLPESVERVRRESLELVGRLPLDSDVVDRLLQSAWARPALGGDARLGRLPRPLRRRVIALESEMDAIRERFVSANQGLVAHVVHRYRGMGLSREDLIQEGNIGLMRAVDKFDHRRGTRFGAYAIWWIRQGVRRALANQSRTIRIPVHALGTRYTLDQVSKRLATELGRAPSELELSSATGVAPASVSHVMSLVKEPLSLDAPRGPENDSSLGESVADAGSPSPSDHAMTRERAEQLHGLLDGLSAREREMLRMRFGLDGADECTLEEIGRSFALTRERVRQIVTAALGKLHRQTQLQDLELQSSAE